MRWDGSLGSFHGRWGPWTIAFGDDEISRALSHGNATIEVIDSNLVPTGQGSTQFAALDGAACLGMRPATAAAAAEREKTDAEASGARIRRAVLAARKRVRDVDFAAAQGMRALVDKAVTARQKALFTAARARQAKAAQSSSKVSEALASEALVATDAARTLEEAAAAAARVLARDMAPRSAKEEVAAGLVQRWRVRARGADDASVSGVGDIGWPLHDAEDAYAVLGVRDRACDEDALRRAFRAAALLSHPDKAGASDQFHKVRDAWSLLSDAGRRARYDAALDRLLARSALDAVV